MAVWLQNILAVCLVSACGMWAVWQGVKSVRGKRSKLGSCCSKGCSAGAPAEPTGRTQFMPADLLRNRAKKG
ncbi:MAG TPA: hypothetical protein VL992_00645 [Tepidisphaeraceae bacterium]|nr:hypothetical protein [Tepidisphaeraceae bacterium]